MAITVLSVHVYDCVQGGVQGKWDVTAHVNPLWSPLKLLLTSQ